MYDPVKSYAEAYGRLEACVDMVNSRCTSQDAGFRRMTEIVAEMKAEVALRYAARRKVAVDVSKMTALEAM